MGFAHNLNVQVGIFPWGILRVNHFEAIIWTFLTYNRWVKFHPITVLLRTHSFIDAVDFLLFLLSPYFPFFGLPVLDRHLNDLERISQ